MANSTCVALKSDVNDVFDKSLKPVVLEQVKKTVQTLVDKSKGLSFDANCKDGWLLTATVLSLTVDDPAKPTTMEAKVLIEGVPLKGSTNGFKASGGAKAKGGMSVKNLEKMVKLIVHDAAEDAMTKRALTHMLKP